MRRRSCRIIPALGDEMDVSSDERTGRSRLLYSEDIIHGSISQLGYITGGKLVS